MNVLLVYPRYPNTFWSFRHAVRFLGKKAAFPPLGLLTVAAMLPPDWQLRLVDLNVRALHERDIAWADMVFVSAMIVQKDSAQEVLTRAKAFGKRTVVGGPYFTSCDRHAVRGVDHFVLNEAEVTLPPFLADLREGTPKEVYVSEDKPNLAKTPTPRWDLIRLKDYATMLLQFTRGCPFDCEFCDITKLYGKKTRLKGAPQFVAEVDLLFQAGYRGAVFVVDDNFVGNMRETKAMLPHLIAWQRKHRFPFTFLTEASVNLAKDRDLMRLMQEAGFNKVFLGIETPSMESLRECKKGQNLHVDLEEVVRIIQSYGMEVLAGFIVGFDSDTTDIFERQIRFIQTTGIPRAMVGLLTALPKTKLWERLHASGRLLASSSGNNVSAELNFQTVMERSKLVAGYKEILATIYSDREYYARVATMLRNLGPYARSKLQWCDIRAFIHSVVRIGIFSPARSHYWKLLLGTRWRTFPLAVEAAIVGRHLKIVAREVIRS